MDKLSQRSLFAALQMTHTPFDYVYLSDDTAWEELRKYEVLFYPHASILTDARMKVLETYVSEGGKLVMGCRTGYKDLCGRCVMDKLPGKASGLTGTDIPEYSFVAPDDGRVLADWDGNQIEAAVFNDLLEPAGEQAEVLARYASSYYAGTPALIRNRYGKGEAYYFGGAFAVDTAKVFLDKLGAGTPYGEVLELPECCELAVREKDGRKYLFVLNYASESVKAVVKKELREFFGGEVIKGEVELGAYEVKIFAE